MHNFWTQRQISSDYFLNHGLTILLSLSVSKPNIKKSKLKLFLELCHTRLSKQLDRSCLSKSQNNECMSRILILEELCDVAVWADVLNQTHTLLLKPLEDLQSDSHLHSLGGKTPFCPFGMRLVNSYESRQFPHSSINPMVIQTFDATALTVHQWWLSRWSGVRMRTLCTGNLQSHWTCSVLVCRLCF